MAGQRELHAAPQRHALDGGNAGLVHPLDLAKGQVRVVRQRARLIDAADVFQQLPDVGPGHEAGRALPGEDHGGHVSAPRQVFDHHRQFVERAFVQRIDRRIGDRDGGHAPVRHRACRFVVLHREIAIALEHLLFISQLLLALPFSDDLAQFDERFRVLQR